MPNITTEMVEAVLCELDADPKNEIHAKAATVIRSLMEIRAVEMKAESRDAVDSDLSERMVKAGMVPLDALMKESGLSRFIRHAGVRTPDDFVAWVTGKTKEYARMQAAHQTGVHVLEPDIEDFILGKASAFGEVMENVKFVFSPPKSQQEHWANVNP